MGCQIDVGAKETKQTKSLTGLVNEGEDLDRLSQNFKESWDNEVHREASSRTPCARDHKPFPRDGTTARFKEMMRRHAKAVLQGLQKIDEIASFQAGDVEFISQPCKVMRSDWKYHVLYDIPGFQQFFHTHMHIINSGEDR